MSNNSKQLTVVRSLVFGLKSLRDEGFITLCTLVRLDARVTHLVPMAVTVIGKGLIAIPEQPRNI